MENIEEVKKSVLRFYGETAWKYMEEELDKQTGLKDLDDAFSKGLRRAKVESSRTSAYFSTLRTNS